MKEYIKFFKFDADYQLAKPNLPEPHAVYCWETNIVDISNPIFNEKQYLAFKAVDGDATLTIINSGGAAPQLWYSYDQEIWTDWTASGYTKIEIMDGKKVYLKGLNDNMGDASKYSTFGGTGYYEVSGSLSSLLDGDDLYGNLNRVFKKYMFYKLFYENTAIKTWDVEIPYNNNNDSLLQDYCYQHMFTRCTNLTRCMYSYPDNMGVVGENCYSEMFNGCSSLVYCPGIRKIPDTVHSIKSYSFHLMFKDCTLLSDIIPNIPESLSYLDYRSHFEGMFQNTSVTKAEIIIPEQCTTGKFWMFKDMFSGCKKLTEARLYVHDNFIMTNDSFNAIFGNCTNLTSLTIEYRIKYT